MDTAIGGRRGALWERSDPPRSAERVLAVSLKNLPTRHAQAPFGEMKNRTETLRVSAGYAHLFKHM